MPTFNDPQLQQIAARIDGVNTTLDAVSADIKAAEAYLAGKSLSEEVSFEFADKITACPEIDSQDSLAIFCGSEYIEGEAERLIFGPHGDGGRWRLLYEKLQREGTFGLDPHTKHWDTTQVVERRPLIETKAAVRVRAYKALSELMKEVARRLGVELPPGDLAS